MARTFGGLPNSKYLGTLFDQPPKNNNAIFGRQQQLPPKTVVTQFFWSNYGVSTSVPNIAVNVDMSQPQPMQLLDRIVSVRIDNLGNPVPVYVQFPDTLFTVVAPPNSVVQQDVQTNGFLATVAAEGFTSNNIGATFVYFSNRPAVDFIDYEFSQAAALWLASSTITRGASIYNQNFGVPALGDQTVQYLSGISGAGVIVNNLWGTPLASGFVYLTHIDIAVQQWAPGNAAGTLFWVIESTGSAGLLYQFNWQVANAQLDVSSLKVLNWSGMNIKLDATQTWRARVVSFIGFTAAFIQQAFNFTTNPN